MQTPNAIDECNGRMNGSLNRKDPPDLSVKERRCLSVDLLISIVAASACSAQSSQMEPYSLNKLYLLRRFGNLFRRFFGRLL